MSSQMLNLRGVTVHFPHEPYDVQKKYMEKVIECLQNGVNGILESPTGTGKTLSLLCSSLAWLEDHKAAIQLSAGVHRSSDGNSSVFLSQLQRHFDQQESAERPSPMYPKIIYSSRTHSQLSQAINELKKTNYKYVKSVVLGSRDQLCINPDVQKLQDNASKLRVCRHKVTTRSCPFHLNYDTKMTRSEYQDTPVMDIEDLGKLGKKFVCCPYYAAKTLKGRADIVFMPYNYLVDAKSRKAQGVELEGNVVIFDEAHNIESMCEESMSFQLLSSDLALCIKEITHAAELKQQKETEAAAGVEGVDPDFTLLDVAKIKAILLALEKYVDELLMQMNGDSTTKSGDFMFTMLREAGVSRQNKDDLMDLLDKIVSFLEVNAVGAFSPRGTGLNRFITILSSLYSVEGEGLSVELIFKTKFKVHIQKDVNKKKKGPQDVWTVPSTSAKKLDWCLNCWCFSPSVSMDNLLRQGARCIILTSGTLSPLSSFASELGIPFPVQLENPHVIKEEQIYVSVLSNGYDGQVLNCTYENRNNPAYLASLGRTLCNLCRIIPGGASNESNTAAVKMLGGSRNAFGIPSKESTPNFRNLTFTGQPVADNDENVLKTYRANKATERQSQDRSRQGRSLFDVLNSSSQSKAADFCTVRKINFRSTDEDQTREQYMQNAKKRKLFVPLKGIGPPQCSAICDGAGTSSAKSSDSSKDIWKSVLASLKKSLNDTDYNRVCINMKSYLRNNDSDALAQSLGHSLLDAPDRDELLAFLAKVVSSSQREDFVAKCRAHW
ncbi:hypothetical protein MRX96_041568 [Rhipicephalus microplus]